MHGVAPLHLNDPGDWVHPTSKGMPVEDSGDHLNFCTMSLCVVILIQEKGPLPRPHSYLLTPHFVVAFDTRIAFELLTNKDPATT